jgi:predicted ABC-type ATPase
VAGTVASGKSTVVARLSPALGAGHAVVQLDRLMQAFDGYKDDLAALGAERAFAAWEPAAWAAGFSLLSELTRRRAPIVLELSASHERHPDLLAAFARNGYRTCLIVLDTPLAVCEERLRRRAESETRHVPAHYLESRHAALRALLPRYRAAAGLLLEASDGPGADAAVAAAAAFARREGEPAR